MIDESTGLVLGLNIDTLGHKLGCIMGKHSEVRFRKKFLVYCISIVLIEKVRWDSSRPHCLQPNREWAGS